MKIKDTQLVTREQAERVLGELAKLPANPNTANGRHTIDFDDVAIVNEAFADTFISGIIGDEPLAIANYVFKNTNQDVKDTLGAVIQRVSEAAMRENLKRKGRLL
jgi:hypothetical protein